MVDRVSCLLLLLPLVAACGKEPRFAAVPGNGPKEGRESSWGNEETQYRLLIRECTLPADRVREGKLAWCARQAHADPSLCRQDRLDRDSADPLGAIVRAKVLAQRTVDTPRRSGFVCQGPAVGSVAEFLVLDREPGVCERLLADQRDWLLEGPYSKVTCDTLPPGGGCVLGMPFVRRSKAAS